jgi:hypothetical protein
VYLEVSGVWREKLQGTALTQTVVFKKFSKLDASFAA